MALTRIPAEATAGISWKRGLIRVGGSAALLSLLFLFLPLDDLWSTMRQVPGAVWIGTVAVYMALHLIGVVKWRILVNAAGAGLPALHAMRCYYIGLFSNTFLPSVVGGDVVRAGVAMRRVRSKEGLVLGSAVDRVQDVLGLAGVAIIGALLLPSALDERSRNVFWILAAVCIVGAVGLILVARLLPGRRLPYRIRRRLVRIREAFRALSSRPGRMAAAFMLGMLLQTLQVLLNMWLGGLVGVHAPFQVWLFVWPLAKIAATLPLTQGGIGVREAALATLFAPFGIAAVNAVAVSLVFQVIIISGGLIGGTLAMLLPGGGESPAAPSAQPSVRAARAVAAQQR